MGCPLFRRNLRVCQNVYSRLYVVKIYLYWYMDSQMFASVTWLTVLLYVQRHKMDEM